MLTSGYVMIRVQIRGIHMRKNMVMGALVVAAVSASPAAATEYIYAGSWVLGEGPAWGTNPQVYSGREAAELLFGPSAYGYVISTVDNNPANVNFSAWLDGWGDSYTYAYSGNPAPDTYSLDTGGGGYNSNPGYQSAYSAYVQDHFNGTNRAYTNYAFRVVDDQVDAVPEPATWAMMLFGFGAVGFGMRRRKQKLSVSYA
jgi:hypothetical protein